MVGKEYTLRITLNDENAIAILKRIPNYGLKRKFLENAILHFSKNKSKAKLFLGDVVTQEEKELAKKPKQTTKLQKDNEELIVQESNTIQQPIKSPIPKKQTNTKQNSCFMFDFGAQ